MTGKASNHQPCRHAHAAAGRSPWSAQGRRRRPI